ncbi:hypothetical protein DV735_g4706, partial [Chaetothyriales sp. CBS 134920]
MDRSLDEIVADRQRSAPGGQRRGGQSRRGNYSNYNYPRDGVRKVAPPFANSVLEKYQRANHQVRFLLLIPLPLPFADEPVISIGRRAQFTSLDSTREERTNLDKYGPLRQPGENLRANAGFRSDWVHDRYDDDEPPADDRAGYARSRHRRDDSREGLVDRRESRRDDRRDDRRDNRRNDRRDDRRAPRDERYDEDRDRATAARLRVDNLHYDLTEDDIYELFTRIAPVADVKMRYDRAGRSEGTAFVTYEHVADARQAIREFDGANAKGQPIRLQLLQLPRRDNPFDKVENPRSLLDRVEAPAGRNRRRSESPTEDADHAREYKRAPRRATRSRERRSDVTKPAPENIDRYIPGEGGSRGSTQRGGRRPGERREKSSRGGRDPNRPPMVGGRPRKTQEELDAEMDDYWGASGGNNTADDGTNNDQAVPQTAKATHVADDDVDMIE